jgi:hypothetical protein
VKLLQLGETILVIESLISLKELLGLGAPAQVI